MSYHSTKEMRILRVTLLAGLGILASACDLATAPGADYEVAESSSAMVEVLADDGGEQADLTPTRKQAAEE